MSAQERSRLRGQGGQVTWSAPVHDKLHLPLDPPFVERMLPAWMSPFLPRLCHLQRKDPFRPFV